MRTTLRYERGTLLLHPAPRGAHWTRFVEWDERVSRFRAPGWRYRDLMEGLRADGVSVHDEARRFEPLELRAARAQQPYPHQQEALEAWKNAGRRGLVVLPTGAGKTYLAQLAMQATPRSALICVPTLDLMHQWYVTLLSAYPDTSVGLLGGGSKDETPLLIATYDSAAIHAERLGDRYGLLIFDEAHHLGGEFTRPIAEYAIAPYRLGLTATPPRGERLRDLSELIGPLVYQKKSEELAGGALAPYREVRITVQLSAQERARYDACIKRRNDFLRSRGISLASLDGWRSFVMQSGSLEGRAAMLAHREARALAFGTEGKLRVLEELLAQHPDERTLVFTDDNATVYRISQEFLLPALTHQTPVKERVALLDAFRRGEYRVLITSRVLNEGVDVPEASIAIVLSGTGEEREHTQRLGRILRRAQKEGGGEKHAVLYEVIAENTSEEHVSRRRHGEGPGREERLRPLPYLEDLPTSVNWEEL
ncbi:DEAD/DEAH box helicase [Deinococcus peraridilitoris]|uniref:DNA 3'-5' helicase n=1 Tax=Deinococcus peraridilitoris (strain DSM 19664 / LMG 22246 / CIP 109416 / KR-200) TaxID=937777 RepID=L0A3Z7_DEIPD|nr:DEAD/DEAH box helicase family protein [Deinococcus peraridilitoris]AFZ67745.1 DNA/RNA helicase, superfamily II [Deinococcus peraridilitoris DSM 19664]